MRKENTDVALGGSVLSSPLRSLGVTSDTSLKNTVSFHPTHHEPGVKMHCGITVINV